MRPFSPSIRRPSLVLVAVLAAAAALSAQPVKPKATAKPGASTSASATVITVGSKSIKKSQIDTLVIYMARSRGADANALPPAQIDAMRRLIATNLIGQELLDQEAKAKGLQATPAQMDSAYRALRGQFQDEATFKQAMAQSGETEAKIKEKIARQIRSDKVLQANLKQPPLPTDAEMRAFWEEHKKDFPVNDSLRAVQILFTIDAKTTPEAASEKQRRLETIRKDLLEDSASTPQLLRHFMALAARVSDGPEAQTGGDLQRFLPGDFNAEFRKQVLDLRVGQLSPVFKSPLGYHLVLLIEKFDGKYDSYKLQSLQNIMGQRNAEFGEQMRQFLKKMAVKYPVKYLKPEYRDESESGIY